MKTKEEILDEHLNECCCNREEGYIDEYGVYPNIEAAMEEYGIQMYNQAIEDAAERAEGFARFYIDDKGTENAIKDSILKLKK